MKIKFTKDLRGRILNQDIVLTNITLEEAIQRLKNLGYDITKLSAYAKRVCDSYKLNRILGKLRDVDEEKSKILIRENILNLYGDDIGDNCLNVYLVAYCVNKYPELSVISAKGSEKVQKGKSGRSRDDSGPYPFVDLFDLRTYTGAVHILSLDGKCISDVAG